MTDSLKQAEIDQGVSEGVEIRDGIAIAKVRTFNPKTNRLTVDAFGSRALSVNIFVNLALSVERISESCANAGWHGNCATAFASALMMNRTGLFDEFLLDVLGKERADIFAAFMFDDGHGSVGISEKKWHG